ncbi:hypothetical protein KM295_13250 [Natronomonas sp. F2-12]|jgi:hypothetical protein|uniref:Uncharacterized protein n=1 Tax=Natronomonas aquatica TaxID=2841590 RepID=A0A9R1D5J5_9EURY|nr:hypothetical protein [Natronomonas aquatica]MCQ4334424.1 hypothetical protein [Natronomonas aquatica]
MDEIDTPITRRQALTGIVAAGSSLAGCSSVISKAEHDNTSSTNSTSDEERQQHEISNPLDVAETNLRTAFEMLNEITVIEDDEIIYVDTEQDPDWLDISDKSEKVKAALETASEEYDTDTKRFTRLELGATLLEHRFTSYSMIDTVESRTSLYIQSIRFVQLNGAIGDIDKLSKYVEWITEAGNKVLEAIEKIETHGIDPPEYYNLDRAATESAVFANFKDLMTPWLNGLKEWPNALLWGSDGTRDTDLQSAIDAYENAIDHVTAAQAYFDKRDRRPPVYREPISHASCQLPTLLKTYRTAKMALEHRRDGDEETARQLLEEAHRLADNYREGCDPGNAALVPSIE